MPSEQKKEVTAFLRPGAVSHKESRLFVILGAFFLTNALVAEFMRVKIFSVEKTFGLQPISFSFFGEKMEGFQMTCGVLLWPFVFVMTDIINEYFGRKGVRFFSIIGAVMIGYAFVMLNLAMGTSPAAWWITSSNFGDKLDFQNAYNAVFGQGANIIIGSITAFLIGQFVDVAVFHRIKKLTGEKFLWLRATGSTFVSQFIDTFIVLFVAFYFLRWGKENQWTIQLVLAVGCLNYIFKFLMAILMTPLIYLFHVLVEKYLGHELAGEMRKEAMKN